MGKCPRKLDHDVWKSINGYPGRSQKFMGNKKLMRSQLRHSKLGLIPSRRTKPTVSADYIVGLTDGEGCFYVVLKKPFNKNGGARVQLNFFIKVQSFLFGKISWDHISKVFSVLVPVGQ